MVREGIAHFRSGIANEHILAPGPIQCIVQSLRDLIPAETESYLLSHHLGKIKNDVSLTMMVIMKLLNETNMCCMVGN